MRRDTSDFRTEFTITGGVASERDLRELLDGRAVPTGRIVEVTFRMPDGNTETERYTELGRIHRVTCDPPPGVGERQITGATVLSANERVEGAAYALTPKAEAAVRAFVESVPLTQAAINFGSDALEKEIERSFGEPLDAVPDGIADQRAEAVRRVIRANRLLAEAVEVLGPEAVDLMMHNLAAPDLEAAA